MTHRIDWNHRLMFPGETDRGTFQGATYRVLIQSFERGGGFSAHCGDERIGQYNTQRDAKAACVTDAAEAEAGLPCANCGIRSNVAHSIDHGVTLCERCVARRSGTQS